MTKRKILATTIVILLCLLTLTTIAVAEKGSSASVGERAKEAVKVEAKVLPSVSVASEGDNLVVKANTSWILVGERGEVIAKGGKTGEAGKVVKGDNEVYMVVMP